MVPLAIAQPGHAAERIYVTYNILERSISVEALANYAKHSIMDEDLSVYAQYADPKMLKDLQAVLLSKAEIKPVTIAQFLYSPQGEAALGRLGQVIQPESRISGSKAIRAALILAATEPEGLTLLNFLQKFPSKGIRIDVERSVSIVSEFDSLLKQTTRATKAITDAADAEMATDTPLRPDQPDLRKPGSYKFRVQTITLNDPGRGIDGTSNSASPAIAEIAKGRVYKVDIYLPTFSKPAAPKSVPVVVISHGLGSDRTSFVYLAKHLASHGFAVLVPEHPGSDSRHMEALLQGVASEISDPSEFANRPLDISYLLDYLERQAPANPDYQTLNLKQVGVIGQSFGGYTALALAGAPISFQELQKNCRDLENTFNISLLLQCRAEQLAQPGQTTRTDFRDPRIQAAIALNPITSAVMGSENLAQIKIPTMILGGSADTVAPALFEQVKPFTALTTENKYLVLLNPGTHFSVIGDSDATGSGAVNLPPEIIGPSPATARTYTNALALAFFQTYIANKPSYRDYLTSSYARSISNAEIRMDLVRSLTANQISDGRQDKLQTNATVGIMASDAFHRLSH